MSLKSLLAFPILISFAALVLSSCQDHKDAAIDTFGQMDSSLIAADTTMQINLDRSYEFQKKLVKNDTEVYDFLAYDKPKGASSPDWESKFIVIRRTTHEYDTIIKDLRYGKVQSIMLSDMDHNGRPEIIFYTRSDQAMKKVQDYAFYAYEVDGRAKAHKITGEIRKEPAKYGQQDTFFVADDLLVRRVSFHRQASDTADSGLWQSYSFRNGMLSFEKERKVSQ